MTCRRRTPASPLRLSQSDRSRAKTRMTSRPLNAQPTARRKASIFAPHEKRRILSSADSQASSAVSCVASEVRDRPHALRRLRKQRGSSKLYDSSSAFRFKLLNELGSQAV